MFIPTEDSQLLSASSTQCTESQTWQQMCHKHPSPGLPFCSSVKGTSALADRGIHAGGQRQMGSSRAVPAPQCCLPTCPLGRRDHRSAQGSQTGATCSCTLAPWPGLTVSLCGSRVRWHPVAGGLSWAGRKVRAGSLWSALGLHDVNAHMPSLLLCSLLYNSNCSHQPVSLRMYQVLKKYMWMLPNDFCKIE